MDYRYTMPQGFMEDKSVPVKWRLYGVVNGFWLSGRSCYGGNPYFAKLLSVSPRQIRNAFAELEVDKLLRRKIKGTTRVVVPYSLITLEEEVGLPPGGSGASVEEEVGVPHISDSIAESKSGALEDSLRVEKVYESEEESTSRKKPKYPNAKNIFSMFPNPQKSWEINTTELKHAELLHARGGVALAGILDFCQQHAEDDFFPSWESPSALERNWTKIQAFANRNGL